MISQLTLREPQGGLLRDRGVARNTVGAGLAPPVVDRRGRNLIAEERAGVMPLSKRHTPHTAPSPDRERRGEESSLPRCPSPCGRGQPIENVDRTTDPSRASGWVIARSRGRPKHRRVGACPALGRIAIRPYDRLGGSTPAGCTSPLLDPGPRAGSPPRRRPLG